LENLSLQILDIYTISGARRLYQKKVKAKEKAKKAELEAEGNGLFLP